MIRRNWRSIFIFLTLSTDTFAILVSGFSAYYIRRLLPNVPLFPKEVFLQLTVYSGAVILFVGMLVGVYRAAFHSNTRQQYFLAAKAYVYSVLIMFSPLQLLEPNQFPLRFVILFVAVLPAFFLLARFSLNRFNLLMQGKGFGIHKVLLAGYDNGGVQVFERFKGFPELGYEIKGVVSKKALRKNDFVNIEGTIVPKYSLAQVKQVVKTENVDRVFVPSTSSVINGYSDLLEVCQRKRIKIKVLSPESDQLLRLARVYDIAGITLYSPPRTRIELVRSLLKRLFDILGSLGLIILFSPIFLTTSAAIALESGLPVFFRQRRSAIKDGKVFYFHKFRSMVKNADELKESLFNSNETDGALFKLKNDPRMTRVGKFIRKFSIDELPQLFNVLKGQMSLVGPRPLPVADFNKVKEGEEFWNSIKDRAKVKPGMTGLWQVSGRSNVGFREMILLDLYYIENQSLLFDLEILFATIPAVFYGMGAY